MTARRKLSSSYRSESLIHPAIADRRRPPGPLTAPYPSIENMLSLRCVMPTMPMVAALSAAHLAAFLFPQTLRRLYIARDNDPASIGAVANLIDRSREAGIEAITLSPCLGDFNEDLRAFGLDALRAAVRGQIVPEDLVRLWIRRKPPPRRRRCAPAPVSSRILSRGSCHQSSERTAPTTF